MLLPPPRPTMASTRADLASARQSSTSCVVGFSRAPPKTAVFSPAFFNRLSTRSAWPAAAMPGSVTSKTFFAPSSRVSSPTRPDAARAKNQPRAAMIIERHGATVEGVRARRGGGGIAGGSILFLSDGFGHVSFKTQGRRDGVSLPATVTLVTAIWYQTFPDCRAFNLQSGNRQLTLSTPGQWRGVCTKTRTNCLRAAGPRKSSSSRRGQGSGAQSAGNPAIVR